MHRQIGKTGTHRNKPESRHIKNNNAMGLAESTAPIDLNRILHSEDPTPYRRLITLQILEKLEKISPVIFVALIAVFAVIYDFDISASFSTPGGLASGIQIRPQH